MRITTAVRTLSVVAAATLACAGMALPRAATSAAADASRPLVQHLGLGRPVWSPASDRCYDQLSVDTGLSLTSDKYEAEFHEYDNRLADDFTLASPCRIRSIDAGGTFFDGIGPPEYEQVVLYADDGGAPGQRLAGQSVVGTYVVGQGDFHLVLDHPVSLPAGTYWLSVRAVMVYVPNGQWGWDALDHQTGALPRWKNPLDGFETGCTTYQPLVVCLGGEPEWYLGLTFAINSSRR